MSYPHWLAFQVREQVRVNVGWMTWNLILAAIPGILALLLFLPPHRRRAAWWAGVVAFVLFLPNAPYVITDLIHLRWDAARASSDDVLVFGVLPLYGAFIVAGFTSYLVSLELVVREVQSVRTIKRWVIELAVHATCSLGIVLGRIARLNTWDTIQDPSSTMERTFNTLTWRGAPFVFAVTFVAVWLTSAVLRTLAIAIGAWIRRRFERSVPPPAAA